MSFAIDVLKVQSDAAVIFALVECDCFTVISMWVQRMVTMRTVKKTTRPDGKLKASATHLGVIHLLIMELLGKCHFLLGPDKMEIEISFLLPVCSIPRDFIADLRD